MSPSFIETIVTEALTLDERLQLRPGLPQEPQAHHGAQNRLHAWSALVASGIAGGFERRLAWDGHDPVSIQPFLASSFQVRPATFPSWAVWLDQAVASLESRFPAAGLPSSEIFDARAPVPFEHLLVSFVMSASEHFGKLAATELPLLDADALRDCQRGLLEDLAEILSPALSHEFEEDRSRAGGGSASSSRVEMRARPTAAYTAFIRNLAGSGLQEFFTRYPALARLVATRACFWAESLADFLRRLASDRAQIERLLGAPRFTPLVRRLACRISDSHHRGRTVLIPTFADGTCVVYKPRDLAIDRAFSNLVNWLNSKGEVPPLRAALVIERDGYGWSEFIDHHPPCSLTELRGYFTRCGMLLCLVQVLQGTDCHLENLRAEGSSPVLVDIETLLGPDLETRETWNGAAATRLAANKIQTSVLRTGFLPDWIVTRWGERFDPSGLGSGGSPAPGGVLQWRDINTDAMRVDEVILQAEPHAGGSPLAESARGAVDVGRFEKDVVGGYTTMYRFLLRHRDELIAEEGPLSQFRGTTVRVLLRDTSIYARLLATSFHPDVCRSGIDRSLFLDRISRAYILEAEKPAVWALSRAERQALEVGDIPYVSATADGYSLRAGPTVTIAGAVRQPGLARAKAAICGLSPDDLRWQIECIRATFDSRAAAKHHGGTRTRAQAKPAGNLSFTPDRLITAAARIGDELVQRAVKASDGTASWIGLDFSVKSAVFRLQVLDGSLYSGAGGICLFLAALSRFRLKAEYRQLALAGIRPLQLACQDPERYFRRMSFGGFHGLGSVIYVMTRVGALLEEDSLEEDALRCVEYLITCRLRDETELDVLGGVAGGMLAAAALRERSGSPRPLHAIRRCGEYLLRHGVRRADGGVCWPAAGSDALCGMSHGAAGIAWALIRAWQVTGDERFRDTARRALAYERSLFDTNEEGWPDLRQRSSQPAVLRTWCNGTAGAGLARLGILAIDPIPGLREEVETAIRHVRRGKLPGMQLCCGEAGAADFLLEASRQLDAPALGAEARQRLMGMIGEAGLKGKYCLHPGLRIGANVPGFMQGIAGIGYEMLRLADEEALLSCALLLR